MASGPCSASAVRNHTPRPGLSLPCTQGPCSPPFIPAALVLLHEAQRTAKVPECGLHPAPVSGALLPLRRPELGL